MSTLSPVKVALVRLYPGFPAIILDDFLKIAEGIVIEAFGAGNGPLEIVAFFKNHPDNFFAVCTNCSKGYVTENYEVGLGSKLHNVALCEDMTPECAMAKLAFVSSTAKTKLKESGDKEKIWEYWKKVMELPTRGEMKLKSKHF